MTAEVPITLGFAQRLVQILEQHPAGTLARVECVDDDAPGNNGITVRIDLPPIHLSFFGKDK